MPNCYQLTRKSESEPSTLVSVDEALCQHFGVEIHPKKWYLNWHNYVGLGLACGDDWTQLRKTWEGDKPMLDVIDFLEKNYESSAWYSLK